MQYVSTDAEGRIAGIVDIEEYAPSGAFPFEFPEGFDVSKSNEYLIIDGQLEHSPKQPSPEQEIAALKAKLAETDYVSAKIADARITGAEIDEAKYAEILESRERWRDRIRELENR